MILEKLKKDLKIITPRLQIKNISVKEANKNYLSWFNRENTEYIIDAKQSKISLDYLKKYIAKNLNDRYTIFLAIFTKQKIHIGNIKFYNIDLKKKISTLGIWIGNRNYLNKGLAYEGLYNCIKHLYDTLPINRFQLGVEYQNKPAIKLYKKIGFKFYKKKSFAINMYLSKKNFFKNVQ